MDSMDILSPDNTFILICPKCKILAFHPKICVNCNSEIPPSTRIKVVNRYNRVFETTGYHFNNFSKSTFAFLNEASSSEILHKAAIFPKSDTESDLRRTHDENCACVKYLKTEEEVKKSFLKTEGDEVRETVDELHQYTTEEHNSNSASDSSNFVHPAVEFIAVYDNDLNCLADGEELNDNIIDSYLKHVYYKIIPLEFQSLTHIFSACFNRFLKSVFEKKSTSKDWCKLEKSVIKWVKHVDIFSKDFIFVPINREKHWYLAVICFITHLNKNSCESKESPEKNFFEDRSPDARKKDHPYLKKGKPCICFFDSNSKSSTLGKKKMLVAQTLKEFLKVLWNSKNPAEPYDWNNLLCLKAVCPQQENDVDCGLYLLQYVESFFKNPIPYFENPMPVLRNWFPKSVMTYKRKQIKEVVSERRIKLPQTTQSSGSDVTVLSP